MAGAGMGTVRSGGAFWFRDEMSTGRLVWPSFGLGKKEIEWHVPDERDTMERAVENFGAAIHLA